MAEAGEGLRSFAAAAAAASGAVLVSHVPDTVRLRLQLSRELGGATGVHYRGVAHCMREIVRTEGWLGLYKGLAPALLCVGGRGRRAGGEGRRVALARVCSFQVVMNGIRLGSYPSILHAVTSVSGDSDQRPPPWARATAGLLAGAMGSFLAMPAFVVKNRLQSMSSTFKPRESYAYRGMQDAFASIFRSEGVRGLFRGSSAAVARVGVGSAAQLATYGEIKQFLERTLGLQGEALHAGSALVAAAAVVSVMNPFDLVTTRMTQAKDKFYSGPVDCFMRTYRAEGVRGLYKGAFAAYLRLGPHTVLTFVLLELFRPALGLAHGEGGSAGRRSRS
jgi:solute carrier family 25 protein 34/35